MRTCDVFKQSEIAFYHIFTFVERMAIRINPISKMQLYFFVDILYDFIGLHTVHVDKKKSHGRLKIIKINFTKLFHIHFFQNIFVFFCFARIFMSNMNKPKKRKIKCSSIEWNESDDNNSNKYIQNMNCPKRMN